jgi:hypothetical protein
MKDFISVAAFVVLVGALCVIGYLSVRPPKTCDKTIVLHDGTTIKARQTSSYMNHMTYVVTCEGDKIEIPTENIKMIK